MNKKRLFGAFLIITALIVMLLPAAEADAETSASAFAIKSGKLKEYKGASKTVSVPDTVTVIGEGAFEDNDNVTKIILPDSVKKIESYAFWGCDNLETVVLGEGLSVIDDFAFINCDGLETMTLPSNIRSIGIQAFADCNSFEDITIPPQVTDISEDAFDGDYLLNIHCETGSYADKYAQAFYERQKEMTVYEEPEKENSSKDVFPEDGVYSGADADKEELPEEDKPYYEMLGELFGSTTVVDNQAVVFMQNAGLPVQDGSDGDEAVPGAEAMSGVVAERAYYRDDSLKEAAVEDGTVKIGQFAYARSAINELTLPQGLEEIDYASFYHCNNLTSVTIPETVTSVSAKAFAHTPWVENFLSGASADNGGYSSDESDFLISGGVLVSYRGDAAEVVIPDGVRVIAGDAFEDHGEIQKVILPASVTHIDEEAFAGCNPEEVEYSGSMDMDLVEERVSIGALSAAPETTTKNFPVTWIVAIIMLLSGCIFVVHKSK